METVKIEIDGMKCDGCAERIEGLLGKKPGVRETVVSYADGGASVTFNPHSVTEKELHEVIERAGFSVRNG